MGVSHTKRSLFPLVLLIPRVWKNLDYIVESGACVRGMVLILTAKYAEIHPVTVSEKCSLNLVEWLLEASV